MNQRIKELYEQAHVTETKQVRKGGWDNDREPFEYRNVTETNFDPEKFAELIVQECIDIIAPYTVRMSRPGEEYLHPILEIRKNFGVKL